MTAFDSSRIPLPLLPVLAIPPGLRPFSNLCACQASPQLAMKPELNGFALAFLQRCSDRATFPQETSLISTGYASWRMYLLRPPNSSECNLCPSTAKLMNRVSSCTKPAFVARLLT